MDPSLTHFPNQASFRAWLRKHNKTSDCLVLRIAKNHAAHLGITYAQALDEALCFGWIDGVRRALDAYSYSVRFTPRKPRSIWSRVNVRHAKRLVQARRMTKAGLAAFHARTESRTGLYSFEHRPIQLGKAHLAALRRDPRAWTYFQREAPWYRRTSSFWILSAKREETRQRRLAILIACSAKGERIPALRRPVPSTI